MGSETGDGQPKRRVPGAFPADLTATLALTVLTVGAVFLPVIQGTLVRVAFALCFVLFVPGWALVSALFPGDPRESTTPVDTGGVTLYERVALSFGTSIAIVPVVGLVLNFTPTGIQLVPIVLSHVVIVGVLVAVAYRRRQKLPRNERFAIEWRTWFIRIRSALIRTDGWRNTALSVIVVVSLLLAIGSVGFAATFPKQGAPFTEFYILTENETGDLTTEGYPENFTVGEPQQLTVGIQNNEHQSTEYTTLVELQRVSIRNNSTRVRETERLDRFETTLAANETWHHQHRVTPSLTGDDLRLAYLLYKGDPPANPSVENAYREVHLWVDVNDSARQP